MKQVLAIVAAASLLVGCSSSDDRIAFDGQYYRAKVKRVDGSFDQFTVAVKPVSASLDGAREAGRFEAITYCVNSFGSSSIDWVVGPDTPAESLTIEADTLVFQGSCPKR